MMRLLLVLILATGGLACANRPEGEDDSTATGPATRQSHNGVLRDPVGGTFVIEGTVRGQATLR